MVEKYTADWVEEQARLKNASWLHNHDCCLCGVPVGYVIYGSDVLYRSSCDCSWSHDRPSSFQEIADWLAMKRGDEVRDQIMEGMR